MLIKNKKFFFWITGLCLLTYIWTVFFKFTYLDDQSLILDNIYFLRNLGNIFNTFFSDVFRLAGAPAAYYRPILTISLMIDAQISGSNPFFYHFMNVVIHIVASCTVFIFLQKIKIKKEVAFLLSAIFVVHPVLSQAVAWIPGRNDSLLTLFSLLSFIFFIDFTETGNTKDIVWHLLFFTLALFTKESAILTAPLIVFYYLLFNKKKILSGNILVSIAWAAIVGVWLILRSTALLNPIKYTLSEAMISVYQSLPALLIYIGKIFFPVNLSVFPTIQDSSLVWGILAILLLFIFVIISKNKNIKLVIFGTSWFLVILISSFIVPDTQYTPYFLEHRIYFSLIGLLIVVGEIDFVKKVDLTKRKYLVLIGSLISILICINFMHTWVFRDKIPFWQSAVKTSPHHPFAHKNLGAMYYLAGDLNKAEAEDKIAIQLNPDETLVHNNLGLIYVDLGQLDKAEEEYKKELEINPNYDNTLNNYGILYFKEGKYIEAEKMWLKVLSINPNQVDAIRNLAILYYQNKDMERANYYYNELIKRGGAI